MFIPSDCCDFLIICENLVFGVGSLIFFPHAHLIRVIFGLCIGGSRLDEVMEICFDLGILGILMTPRAYYVFCLSIFWCLRGGEGFNFVSLR